MAIDDIQEGFQDEMDKINEKMLESAAANGISKEAYYKNYGFAEFKLTEKRVS